MSCKLVIIECALGQLHTMMKADLDTRTKAVENMAAERGSRKKKKKKGKLKKCIKSVEVRPSVAAVCNRDQEAGGFPGTVLYFHFSSLFHEGHVLVYYLEN